MSNRNPQSAAIANRAHAERKRAIKAGRERIPCLRCRNLFGTEDRKRNRICKPCTGDIECVSPLEPESAAARAERRVALFSDAGGR